jgi:hypothetical protein
MPRVTVEELKQIMKSYIKGNRRLRQLEGGRLGNVGRLLTVERLFEQVIFRHVKETYN